MVVRQPTPKPFKFGLSHLKALAALGRFDTLTRAQVQRRYFAPTATSYAKEILKDLTDNGYAFKDAIAKKNSGNSTGIWDLEEKGRRLLQARGMPNLPRVHKSREHRNLFLLHLLSINDFLISLELMEERYEEIGLVRVVHQRLIDAKPPKVRLTVKGQEVERQVKADAWVDLRVDGSQVCVWLEMDKHTEDHEEVWRGKVERIVAFAESGGYQEYFQAEPLRIAVVAANPSFPPMGANAVTLAAIRQTRRDLLKRWTELELSRLERTQWGELFYFTAQEPGEAHPVALFCEPTWRQPFVDEPAPLLEGGS